MQKNIEKLSQKNVQIKVISFAKVDELKKYQDHFQWKFDLYSDPERKLYQLFGMKKGNTLQVFHPKTVLKYFTYFLQGKKIEKTKDDIYQLGGDILLDSRGEVRARFCSERPDDRPSMDILLNEIKKLR